MDKKDKVILWFNEVTKKDVPLVGGKGANLGELVQAQLPVPAGFIVTAMAFSEFLKETKLEGEIRHLLEHLNPEDTKALQEVANKIKQKIYEAPIPLRIVRQIKEAYRRLGNGLVAVRSSATAEDLPEASFAGQQRTFLNIIGEAEVVKAVQGCWASLFEPRAIFYRYQHGFDHFKVSIAVPVQRMVQAEASGVLFTVEPLTNDKTKIVIEAIFGLGEAVVSGEVTPDLYIVDKKTLKIIDKRIGKQEWQILKNPEIIGEKTNIKVPISLEKQREQKIKDEEIIALAALGRRIEDLYQFPQDIEWAKQNDEIFIVQTRPVTTLKVERVAVPPEINVKPILTGVAASPGIATGLVKLIANTSELDKVVNGDILVTEMTTPDFVPAMKRAIAIVTDRGGRTAHAAIVSRELGIPCVVGTEIATKILRDGQEITVDGFRGRIYQGKVITETVILPKVVRRERVKTITKVYVNLAEPELAEVVAAKDVDGVGLLRAEFMIAQIGEHPRFILSQNKGSEFVNKLAKNITIFAKAFYPRPVVYRTTDFKTNEYRNLIGGEKYEELEENPMLGYRGCSRYIRELDILKLEIDAIKKVREKYSNLWVMIPFVRFVRELAEVKKVFEREGLYQSADFKLWMMVEVPSNIFLMEKFIDVGIDGISIGSNDLTQLILGIDRDNSKLADQFDERDEAVLLALERAIKISKSRGITSSICGQAPSVYPELTEKLVEWGITSVSVSPDMIDETRQVIAAAEAKLGYSIPNYRSY